MNTIIENMTGMNIMTDQVIAADLLFAAKTGIKNYALALTEAASPEIRNTLRKQLDENITFHETVTRYMMDRGWYKPYDLPEQLQVTLNRAETALNVSTQQQGT